MTTSTPWQKNERLALVRPRPWVPEIDPDSDNPGEEVPTWPDCEQHHLTQHLLKRTRAWQT